jgi:hypothetical protein
MFAYQHPLVPAPEILSACAAQGVQLASTDGSVYLVAQADGDLVLYNANLVNNQYGTTPAAAVWYSGTSSAAGPFTVLMQEARLISPHAHKRHLHVL